MVTKAIFNDNKLICEQWRRIICKGISKSLNRSSTEACNTPDTASPQPSPKGEGEQLARFPGVFESAEHGV